MVIWSIEVSGRERPVSRVRGLEVSAHGSKASKDNRNRVLWMNLPERLLSNFCVKYLFRPLNVKTWGRRRLRNVWAPHGFVQEDKDITITVEQSIFNHDVNTSTHIYRAELSQSLLLKIKILKNPNHRTIHFVSYYNWVFRGLRINLLLMSSIIRLLENMLVENMHKIQKYIE